MPKKAAKNCMISTQCTEFLSERLKKQPSQSTDVLGIQGLATGKMNDFLALTADKWHFTSSSLVSFEPGILILYLILSAATVIECAALGYPVCYNKHTNIRPVLKMPQNTHRMPDQPAGQACFTWCLKDRKLLTGGGCFALSRFNMILLAQQSLLLFHISS